MFLPSDFLLKSSLQTQKSTFTAKFSPSPSIEVIFSALIPCCGQATAFHSSAYWPCLDFQHHDCTACWEIARIFRSVRPFPHIFHIYTTVHSHSDLPPKFLACCVTRFFEKVDSQLPSRLMMLIRQPLKMKNGCELTKNRRYTVFEPLL